jgi:transposase InsO family protein
MERERREIYKELHRPVRHNFVRRKYEIRSLHDSWQSDLIDMQAHSRLNKGYKYILVAINNFSKFVYLEALKSKSGPEVSEAFERILKRAPVPVNLQTDKGKEYFNQHFKRLMKRYKINHYATHSELKCGICERVNRTLKSMLYKNFSIKGKFEWLSDLKKLVAIYNNTVHSTIKMRPVEVSEKNEKQILRDIYQKVIKIRKDKFAEGDKVRVSRYKKIFDKSYHPNWSYEVYTIHKKLCTNPTTYVLKDGKDEILQGCFYEMELMKTKHADIYLIEKIIRRKGNKMLVKWMGHDSSYNSWI